MQPGYQGLTWDNTRPGASERPIYVRLAEDLLRRFARASGPRRRPGPRGGRAAFGASVRACCRTLARGRIRASGATSPEDRERATRRTALPGLVRRNQGTPSRASKSPAAVVSWPVPPSSGRVGPVVALSHRVPFEQRTGGRSRARSSTSRAEERASLRSDGLVDRSAQDRGAASVGVSGDRAMAPRGAFVDRGVGRRARL